MQDSTQLIWIGGLASLIAGLGTGVGALGIFLLRGLSPKIEDMLLSAAAGIMLAASFFSLLLPAIEIAGEQADNRFVAVLIVIGGLLLGAVLLWLIHRFLPHEHFIAGAEGPAAPALRRIWLFIIAITLHNFPEGMAVGVGFAGGNMANGISLATGIGLQNIPEGLAVAVSLMAVDTPRGRAFLVALLTGLVEPVGGLLGSAAVGLAAPLMPWTLAFAAGAMLFIISDEIIPETHRGGYEQQATFALLVGFIIMMFLDVTLG
ncbi:MAG: ZIP family metal transporter [Fidelibacterota bacterium]|nr:MAG: ZIP family metal transporter [Candidatus Neomarinimicrobiota bacterium]